jgi:hypothetical protein
MYTHSQNPWVMQPGFQADMVEILLSGSDQYADYVCSLIKCGRLTHNQVEKSVSSQFQCMGTIGQLISLGIF